MRPKLKLRDMAPPGSFPVHTAAAGLERRSQAVERRTPAEIARQEDAMSVALARRTIDPMDGSPLGRYCRQQWPVRPGETIRDLNEDWRNKMFAAGGSFGATILHHRSIIGAGLGFSSPAEGLLCGRTDAEMRAEQDRARIKREDAEGALRCVHNRAVSATTRVCADDLEPWDRDRDLLSQCLYRLAVHFTIIKPFDNAR